VTWVKRAYYALVFFAVFSVAGLSASFVRATSKPDAPATISGDLFVSNDANPIYIETVIPISSLPLDQEEKDYIDVRIEKAITEAFCDLRPGLCIGNVRINPAQ